MNQSLDSTLKNLSQSLLDARQTVEACRSVTGFDGFVDEMISVVDERKDLDHWTAVADIRAFGEMAMAAAGRSSLREIVIHRADPGGCAVNLGDGLLTLGIQLDCYATLGQPRHSAFDEFARQCRQCDSWGQEPGRTLAFEFNDGKLMFSAVRQLADFTPELLETVLADGRYAASCSEAGLIALTDWTLYPHMTACWGKLQQAVYSNLTHQPWFFLDLVDPSGRSSSDIQAMLETLPGFESSGRTVLGLNGNEANLVARALNLPEAVEEMDALQQQAQQIRQSLGISQVVTHGLKVAVAATSEGTWGQPGPYCENPKKSTGAGDRFNAGYCLGLLLEKPVEDCLRLGNANSGFFVREARSARLEDLAGFLDRWADGLVDQ